MTERNGEIETAYRKAVYVVSYENTETIFRIGEHSAAIDGILAGNQAEVFAFITAYNPRSKEKSKTENEARQNELKQTLHRADFKFLDGYGTDENRTWQPEQSVFIFGISKAKAVQIGREFGQNAIVCGEIGGDIELIWCREKK